MTYLSYMRCEQSGGRINMNTSFVHLLPVANRVVIVRFKHRGSNLVSREKPPMASVKDPTPPRIDKTDQTELECLILSQPVISLDRTQTCPQLNPAVKRSKARGQMCRDKGEALNKAEMPNVQDLASGA
jgi:hypothetical protein